MPRCPVVPMVFWGSKSCVWSQDLTHIPLEDGPPDVSPTVYVWEFLSNCGVWGKFGVSFQGIMWGKIMGIWGIWKGGNGFSVVDVVESELVSLPETASWPVKIPTGFGGFMVLSLSFVFSLFSGAFNGLRFRELKGQTTSSVQICTTKLRIRIFVCALSFGSFKRSVGCFFFSGGRKKRSIVHHHPTRLKRNSCYMFSHAWSALTF